ncbi:MULTISPECIES: deoxynucleoside kinase [Segatella]|uniref:Deoxyguanosine kinase/deoxyadenosine kinase subunit n=2 Tax=Segatella TaxID=2974251 RepID=D8DW63_9BACT|nr:MULTISPECIES: deoxynucleoside kinase [Segatella]EFI72300.1 deoxyguanosine kinase/deoxyadenosine kinase subunit [Segatella baroniae B14]OYP56382.1 deoxynucleoside kinase [Segatella bryantii]UKK77365.1 deoxynucleoside kinase [Segatella baroniae B14]UKK80424.1 deoxynucleoside kinase [Segatella bryantii]SDZ85356.1 Deoxyadenosine/deoxycytidine kinase [Segatella bryantii]
MHIVIAGNIGSGKTTLTKLLAQHYGWTPRFESVENNPYLSDYYKDIPRWSFNMEIFFLKQRFRDLLAINRSDKTIVQDRSIYEGVHVFATTNKEMGHMSDRDFETYIGLFESMMMIAKQPDLMIYLRASVPHLVANIEKRGRDYEQAMPLEYLQNLNDRYEDFVFHKYKGDALIVDVDHIDFLKNKKDLGDIIDKIDARLFGLFNNNRK